jgi:hypothetical protein
MTRPVFLGLPLVLVALGCGGGPAPEPATDAPAEVAQAPAAGRSPRTFASVDLCALVPASDVADALDASLDARMMKDGSKGDTSEMASNCWYWIVPQGASDSDVEPYIVWLTTPELYESAEPDAEAVAGLQDEAHIRFDAGERQYRLVVLRRGDFLLEVIGQQRERTRRLAELVLARLDAR